MTVQVKISPTGTYMNGLLMCIKKPDIGGKMGQSDENLEMQQR